MPTTVTLPGPGDDYQAPLGGGLTPAQNQAPDLALFGRTWLLEVGPKGGGEAKAWDTLRVGFSIRKGASSKPNEATIKIFNLSEASRTYLARRGLQVRLSAGYRNQNGRPLLFSGELGRCVSTHRGPDWETEIHATDGGIQAVNTILSKSFGRGIKEDALVRYIAKELGVQVGTLKGLSDTPLTQGRQLSGPAVLKLDQILAGRRLRWSIQDGVLHVLPVGQALAGEAVVLSSATGLIGSPELTEKGAKASALLQRFTPGQLVDLRGQATSGIFIVEGVEYEGDSHAQAWEAHLELIKRA